MGVSALPLPVGEEVQRPQREIVFRQYLIVRSYGVVRNDKARFKGVYEKRLRIRFQNVE